MFTDDNLPNSLKFKPFKQRQAFIKAANSALQRKLSEEDAQLAGLSAIARLYKPVVKQEKVIPFHLQAVIKSKELKEQPEVKTYIEAQRKAELDANKQITSVDFDKEGRLVMKFSNGDKLVTKQSAPSNKITNNTTVVVQNQESELYTKRVDFITDNLFYKGEAIPGSLESAAVWRISLISIAVDGDISETWSNGTAAFNKVWDDRLTYAYN
jgi:hypothetical protein